VKVPVAAAKQAPAPGFGVLTLHTIKGRLQVLRPDGVVLDIEHTARRGVAGGYASLDSSGRVPFAQLGTGTATGSKFLRDDLTWQVPAGGGGGAPTDAQYLTLTTNATLTQERTLSLTLPLSGSDGGAGAAYTFSLSGWSGTTDGRLLYRNGTALATATVTAPVVFSGGALSVSVFTGDSGSGGTTGLVPAPSAGDGMAGKYLAADGTWTQLPAGLATFYLDPADSSDIATYKTALVAPATTAETTLTVGATGTGDNLLAAFATEPTVPGVTLLPHGVVSFHLHVATGASNQIGRVKVEIYTCNASGGSETLQASGYSDSFFDAAQDINVDINIATGAAMATTDRLVFKVSAARVSGPSTCNITVYFNGTTRLAFAKTTIGALTPQIVGAQPWGADLTALDALGNGLPVRSGGTWTTATFSAPLQLSATNLSIDTGTTAAVGVLRLGTDGESTAGVAVQCSDSRLLGAVPLYRIFTYIQAQGAVVPNVDGAGATITSAGLYSVNPSEAGFPAVQYGDASAAASRFYVAGAFRIEVGTVTTDVLFKMGSDIAAGITVVHIGFSSNASLQTADPTGHRYTIRWARGTDTNWQLSTKDNVTQTLADTGVAVTADYYYAVRFVATSSSVSVKISAAATVAAVKSGIDAAGTTSSSTNLPGTGNDLLAIFAMQRSAASTNRCLKFSYWRTIQVPG
jgi:hypothetical protein